MGNRKLKCIAVIILCVLLTMTQTVTGSFAIDVNDADIAAADINEIDSDSSISDDSTELYETQEVFTADAEDVVSSDMQLVQQIPEWYENGKETGNFEIGSAQALIEFADIVNSGRTTFSGTTVELTADIDMSSYDWEPIGNSMSVFFSGTFDGNEHTIKNINMTSTDVSEKYMGFFGFLKGRVTNVTFEDCSFDMASMYSGVIAGLADTASVITDCNISDVSLKTSGRYTGGAAGYARGIVSDVTVTGSIIVGNITADTDIDIDIDEYCCGGVLGAFEGTELRHVINRADVSFESNISSSIIYIGGTTGKTSNTSLIINCANNGIIKSNTSSNSYAGGIAGRTDASYVKNCWNKGKVICEVSSGLTACSGGLLGESAAGTIYNSYNDNAEITGSVSFTGYIAGNISADVQATVLDYVYWPGSSIYTSNSICGSGSVPADTQMTCRGIKKISSSSSLVKRLNNQVINSCDDETLKTDMYMWKLTDESDPKSSPEFRESSPAPIFPNRPSMTVENDNISLHVYESDPAHTAQLNVSVKNSNSDINMTYQWQASLDNISFHNISDSKASSEDKTGMHSLSISGMETGIEYYRLKVICSDKKADADRSYYSEAITVKTGYRIKFAAGDYFDGSAAVTDSSKADDLFPVIPDSGAVALPNAVSSGNFFLGYAESYSDGQVYNVSELINEYDSSGMAGDVTLWSIFRPAAKVTATIDAGSESAKTIEGVSDDKLSFILDEGYNYVLPDGNDFFVNEGWRFIGWRISGGHSADIDDEFKIYAVGDTYITETYDIRVKAVWSKLYTVSYESSLTYTGKLPEPVQYIEGETVTVADVDIACSGYKLKNWIDSAGNQQYKAETEYKMPAQDVVMYANWISMMQITFKPSESSNIEVSGTESLARTVNVGEGEYITLPDQGDMSVEDYQFIGWSDTSNIGRIFKPGERYRVSMSEEFSGVWYRIATITFDRGFVEGETISGSDPEMIKCVENTSIQLPSDPYKVTTNKSNVKLYKLTGWLDNETGIIHSPLSSIKIGKKDISYTAQWKAVDDSNSWSGSYHEITEGSGTEEDPYIIKTPEELAYISHIVLDGKDTKGMYFSLANDIDLTGIDWTPIGMYYSERLETKAPFNGIFRGNGYSITGLTSMYDMSGSYVSVGLFGYTESSAEISDLNVADADITASLRTGSADGNWYADNTKYIGVLVGINKGSIINCTVSGQLKINHGDLAAYTKKYVYAGGITGKCEGASIRSSENNASILYTRADDVEYDPIYIGGITGYTEASEITGECVNNGDISFENEGFTSNYMGGITAYADSRSKISSCTNNGDITRTDGGHTMMGGIVGLLYCNASECENNGRVEFILRRSNTYSGSEGYQFTGGIAGSSYGKITQCTNRGDVINTVKSSYHHVSAAGGISGAAREKISRCENTGSVNMDAYVAKLDTYWQMSTGPENQIRGINVTAGGIAGELCNASVENSFSYGRALTTLYDSAFDFRTGENAWLGMSEGGIVGIVCDEYTHGYWRNDNPSLDNSSITNCYWLVASQSELNKEQKSTDQESIYASYADGSRRIKAGEKNGGRTAEQFKSGEVAYLVDGGAGARINSWTQGDDYAEFGSPQYYKAYIDVDSSNGSATLRYGTNESTTIYAPSDGEVSIVIPKGVTGYEQAYGDPYDKYDERTSGGVIHYWKQDYYINMPTVTVKKLKNSEKIGTEKNQNGSDIKFKMPQADVVVQLAFMEQNAFIELIKSNPQSVTKVTRNESQFEAGAEPEHEPQPDNNKGGGGGGNVPGTDHEGENQTPDIIRGQDNKNTSTEGEENGTGIPSNTMTIVPTDANISESTIVSQTAPELAENIQIAESAPQQAGDITEDYEEEEQKTDEEQVQQEKQKPEVYEVIQETVKANPVTSAMLFLLILIIITAAAIKRIRRSKSN